MKSWRVKIIWNLDFWKSIFESKDEELMRWDKRVLKICIGGDHACGDFHQWNLSCTYTLSHKCLEYSALNFQKPKKKTPTTHHMHPFEP